MTLATAIRSALWKVYLCRVASIATWVLRVAPIATLHAIMRHGVHVGVLLTVAHCSILRHLLLHSWGSKRCRLSIPKRHQSVILSQFEVSVLQFVWQPFRKN